MNRELDCECCGATVPATSGNQRTCLSKPCQLWLRSKMRKARYYACRPDPICAWCSDPIKEPRRRKYHAECREDKNRERVRLYHQNRGPRQVPKKSRNFDGHLRCMFCRERVKRTGARQLTCKARACVNRLKQRRKKERRDRRRRLEAIRGKKESKLNRRALVEFTRTAHRLAV